MTEDLSEIPLASGRTTPGVVRIGDTVRKPLTGNSAFVASLLEHLVRSGSDFSPEFQGIDDEGRMVLAYIDGSVPEDLSIFDDRTLREAARLIRRFHDLSSGCPNVDTEIVCHNDLSPCNFVFRDGKAAAVIDFDAAGPGTRARDLGYAAWLWLDLGSPEPSVSEQRRRITMFLDAYGTAERNAVLTCMLERQATLIDEGRHSGNLSLSSWAARSREWTLSHLADCW